MGEPQDTESLEALLARARGGDREARERLFERIQERVRAMAHRKLGERLSRELDSVDVQQSALREAHRDLERLTGTSDAELFAWIERIADHKLANKDRDARRLKRDAGRLVRLDATAADGSASGENAAPVPLTRDPSVSFVARNREERLWLFAALDTLPAHWREVVVLRTVHGLDWPTVAERTGQTVKAVQGCFDRARIRLAQLLGD
ncbi:MAG: sigma-70 family RNA polymerase sigma factor [Planctomycetaceae bacterium]|nr:sigma-70 family RNA polymerase sigma factor [Planctomycetaceae bacterium]